MYILCKKNRWIFWDRPDSLMVLFLSFLPGSLPPPVSLSGGCWFGTSIWTTYNISVMNEIICAPPFPNPLSVWQKWNRLKIAAFFFRGRLVISCWFLCSGDLLPGYLEMNVFLIGSKPLHTWCVRSDTAAGDWFTVLGREEIQRNKRKNEDYNWGIAEHKTGTEISRQKPECKIQEPVTKAKGDLTYLTKTI